MIEREKKEKEGRRKGEAKRERKRGARDERGW